MIQRSGPLEHADHLPGVSVTPALQKMPNKYIHMHIVYYM